MNVIRFPVERTQPVALLTLRELQDELKVSERWIRYRVAEGCPVRRYGSRLRFDKAEFEQWLEERYGAA